MTDQQVIGLIQFGQLVVLVMIYQRLRSAFPAHEKTEEEQQIEDYEKWKEKKEYEESKRKK